MNSLKLTLALLFSVSAFTQQIVPQQLEAADSKDRGGGNFQYMRTIDAMSQEQLEDFLKNKGKNFINTYIKPSLLSISASVLSSEKEKDKFARAAWEEMLEGQTSLSLEKMLSELTIENCSCEGAKEEEYEFSHACSVEKENKICFDLKKIYNPTNPAAISSNEVIAMAWHELSHILAEDVDHKHDMLIYRTILKRLKGKRGLYLNSKRNKTWKTCKVKARGSKKEFFTNLSLDQCFTKAMEKKSKKISFELYDEKPHFMFNPHRYMAGEIYKKSKYNPKEAFKCQALVPGYKGFETKVVLQSPWIQKTLESKIDSFKDTKTINLYTMDWSYQPVTEMKNIKNCFDHIYYKNLDSSANIFTRTIIKQNNFFLSLRSLY